MTEGVQSAYGDSKKYLEPLRTLWQGCEGILWLCLGPAAEIKAGEFYLDRAPQRKHMAGPFFSEGSFTKNTPQQVRGLSLLIFYAWAPVCLPACLPACLFCPMRISTVVSTT